MIIALAFIAGAAFNSKPVCKTMTAEIWQKNQSKCFDVFAKAPQPHKIADETAKALCDCVADELVNKMTCKQVKMYDDPDYAAKTVQKITNACRAKVPMGVLR